MGKLRVFVNEYTDFFTTLVLVPTSESHKKYGVFENLVDMAEEVGYDTISGESKKSAFIDTALDVLIVKFVNQTQMKQFSARIRECYEA